MCPLLFVVLLCHRSCLTFCESEVVVCGLYVSCTYLLENMCYVFVPSRVVNPRNIWFLFVHLKIELIDFAGEARPVVFAI